MRVLCCGPESSGTRLLTRIVGSGCESIHRSWPNGREWPDMRKIAPDRVVVIVRNQRVTAMSQVRNGHSPSLAVAHEKIRRAVRDIVTQAEALLPGAWYLVTYESLVAMPHRVARELSEFLNVKITLDGQVYDGNARYG